jgi:hypothetical protein
VHTRRRKTKQKHNTICVGHHYTHPDTNNVNKSCDLLQTTGGNDKHRDHKFSQCLCCYIHNKIPIKLQTIINQRQTSPINL